MLFCWANFSPSSMPATSKLPVWRGVGEEVIRVELFVTKEFPRRAMKLIRARFRRRADDRARRTPELRAVVVGFDFELGHGVHGRNVIDAAHANAAAGGHRVVVYAVEQHVVILPASAATAQGQVRATPSPPTRQ